MESRRKDVRSLSKLRRPSKYLSAHRSSSSQADVADTIRRSLRKRLLAVLSNGVEVMALSEIPVLKSTGEIPR